MKTLIQDYNNAIDFINGKKSVSDIEEIYGDFNDPQFQAALKEVKNIISEINRGAQTKNLLIIRTGLNSIANRLESALRNSYYERGQLYKSINALQLSKKAVKKVKNSFPRNANPFTDREKFDKWSEDSFKYLKKIREQLDEDTKNWFVIHSTELLMGNPKTFNSLWNDLNKRIEKNKRELDIIANKYYETIAKRNSINDRIKLNNQLAILDIITGVFNQIIDINKQFTI